MSKKAISIGAWLGEFFGTSHKAISESLSTEDYNQFVSEAEALAQSDQAEALAAANLKNTDLEGQMQTLQQKLTDTQTAFNAEKKTHEETSAKLADAQTKLTVAEDNNKKLRDAVNPLGDEDLTNNQGENSHLTKTDIEAREAFKKNRPQA